MLEMMLVNLLFQQIRVESTVGGVHSLFHHDVQWFSDQYTVEYL